MEQTYGSDPTTLLAAIGPGVGPCCYTVGEELHTTFTTNFPYADQLFHHTETPETGILTSISGRLPPAIA